MSARPGFTLIELLLVIAIVAISLLTTIPLGKDVLERNRAVHAINGLVGALHFARHAAINNAAAVTLCGSSDLKTCSNNWSAGYIVFLDNDSADQQHAPNKMLRVFPPLTGGASLVWRGFRSQSAIHISPFGLDNAMSGRFVYCPADNSQKYARSVIVNRVGRARLERGGKCP